MVSVPARLNLSNVALKRRDLRCGSRLPAGSVLPFGQVWAMALAGRAGEQTKAPKSTLAHSSGVCHFC